MNKETRLILENQSAIMWNLSLKKDDEVCDAFLEVQLEKTKEALNPKTESAEFNKQRDELMKNKDVEKEMYCAVIDDETGKVCGIVDKTHSAYCSKHGRSTHKMRDITQ